MRIIGKRQTEVLGLRNPTAEEIAWTINAAKRTPWTIPKGVYRYKTQEEADAAMDEWKNNGLVKRFRELIAWKSR